MARCKHLNPRINMPLLRAQAVANEYVRRNIPLSLMIIDFFSWNDPDGHVNTIGDETLPKTCWPDPKLMVDQLKELGVELMVSPYVSSCLRPRAFVCFAFDLAALCVFVVGVRGSLSFVERIFGRGLNTATCHVGSVDPQPWFALPLAACGCMRLHVTGFLPRGHAQHATLVRDRSHALGRMGVPRRCRYSHSVGKGSQYYAEASAKHYLATDKNGQPAATVGPGYTYDLFQPEARAYAWNAMQQGWVNQYGLHHWWLDCDEPVNHKL